MACVKHTQYGYRVDWRDKQGNRYRKTFELKKDATDFLADVQVQKKNGTYVAPKQVPMFREVAHQWFANKQGMKLRPSTLSCYRVNLDCHILQADFADAQLNAVEVADIERFRNALGEKKSRGSQLSVKTINYMLRDLNAIFAYAVKRRVAGWNPAQCVERVKMGSGELVEGEHGTRVEKTVEPDEVLSAAECKAVIEAAPEGFHKAFLMIAIATGSRHDELLALKWADFDFDAGAIHFHRSLSWAKLPGEPKRARFFDTKTGKKGNRKIPCLHGALAYTLKKWRLQCPVGDLDLVFPTPAGLPQHRSRILRCVLRPTLKRAAITRRIDMHTLRHTFCSALLAAGTPPTEVQKYSGHARLSTLLDIYAHFIPSEATHAVEHYAAKVFGV
jgi:integrase